MGKLAASIDDEVKRFHENDLVDRERRFREELGDPHRAPLPPSSDELIEAVRYATREGADSRGDRRRAWARFAASALEGELSTMTTGLASTRRERVGASIRSAAEIADGLLAEYDKRFPQ